MTVDFRKNVAKVWSKVSKLDRATIFGEDNPKWMPVKNPDHARLAAAGWVGAHYRPGGLVIIAANPGGGGDNYSATDNDKNLYDTFRSLRSAQSEDDWVAAFEKMSDEYIGQTTGHSIWLPISRILESADRGADQCAFLNVIPFRTKGDGWPGVQVIQRAAEKALNLQLHALNPGIIVLLGKKACDVYDRHLGHFSAKKFCVPRQRGDRSIPLDAVKELERLRTYCMQA
ncbi:MAG: hypothetical protein ABL951_07950 [Alphaproteobacteria bacterium]